MQLFFVFPPQVVWHLGVTYFSSGAFSLGQCRLQTAKTLLKSDYWVSPSTSMHTSLV